MVGQNAQYLESKVLTAPPHRLHLMLIEGALRFGKQAAEALSSGDQVAASPPLLRVIDIVGEMLAGVRARESEVNDRLAKLYWFLFQRVSEAKIHGDLRRLAEALQLLEYERETWQLACEKVAQAAPAAATLRSTGPRAAAELGLSIEA
jgi:flagellar secretion chaperone FliS